MPQGSFLVPILFSLYTSPIDDTVRQYKLDYHFYADDTHLYVSFQIKNINNQLSRITTYTGNIKSGLLCNLLKLNDDEAEVLLTGSPYHLRNVSKTTATSGYSKIFQQYPCVKTLDALFDSPL